jgi:hypothetical protein
MMLFFLLHPPFNYKKKRDVSEAGYAPYYALHRLRSKAEPVPETSRFIKNYMMYKVQKKKKKKNVISVSDVPSSGTYKS